MTSNASPAPAAPVGIGTALSRVDGLAKVTGTAKYAAEYHVPGLLYGVAVSSRIAKGRITAIDEEAARAVPGVVDIITHKNRPRQAWLDRNWKDELAIPGDPFKALHDAEILFAGQPIAVVVAEGVLQGARLPHPRLPILFSQWLCP
jgi:xanthine dehydrogenase YagR molybdenum-binding subunit